MENPSQSLLLKLDLNGLKVVWLQKINMKINTLTLLKKMMISGEKKEKEFLGSNHTKKLKI